MRHNASVEALKKAWSGPEERLCKYCLTEFEATRWWQIYCSTHCRQAAWLNREIKKAARKRK